MKRHTHGDLCKSIQNSRSGLRDSDRRSLMRLLFSATGSSLTVFALLHFFNNMPGLAVGELLASAVLFTGAVRVNQTRHLQVWIYSYLLALFSFFILIMLVPDASAAAFVWVLMMPVMAYLLLGKKEGPVISAPFMAAGFLAYYHFLGTVDSGGVMIDLLNMVLGGVLMMIFMHMYEHRREVAEHKLVDLAQTDALTGLANRSSFQGTLNRTLAECERSQTSFALVIMDIDHFKMVNDTLGHEAGDQVLRHISQSLKERLRATDSVGRLGGEEFGLILRDVASPVAFQLMDELRERIASTELTYGDASITVTASFGIAYWPNDGRQVHDLFRAADRRLYCGKRGGRNIVAETDSALVLRCGQDSESGEVVVG